jgi:hypothetical protein
MITSGGGDKGIITSKSLDSHNVNKFDEFFFHICER